jgi:hypothetical protein
VVVIGASGVVLDRFSGQLHEGLLERDLNRRQLGQHDLLGQGDLSDRLAGEAVDLEYVSLDAVHARVACGQRVAQRGRLRRDHADGGPCRGAVHEFRDGGVRDEPAATDHHDVLGGLGHLGHQMRGQEHGPAFLRQALEQRPDPQDALGVQSVGGLVEHQDSRVAEQRRGDAQALAHAEREAAHALAGDRLDPDHLDDLVHAIAPDPVSLGQGEQVVVRRPPGVDGACFEHGADLVQRRRKFGVAAAIDGDRSRAGRVQAEDQAHRG